VLDFTLVDTMSIATFCQGLVAVDTCPGCPVLSGRGIFTDALYWLSAPVDLA
jgi:hypothetical protein